MDLLQILYQKGCKLRKAGTTHGGEYQGPCPWCGGTDRFHVWPEQGQIIKDGRTVAVPGRYWCRPGLGHCGRSGDAIQFMIDFYQLSYKEACARLGQHVDPVEQRRHPTRKMETRAVWDPCEKKSPEGMWCEQAKKFVLDCFDAIFTDEPAREYLAGRGISDDTLLTFGLGWNPGTTTKQGKRWGVFKKRESWGLLPEMDSKTGKAKVLWLPVGWVIPYIVGGHVVRIRIRQTDGAEFGPRYYVVPGSFSAPMVIPPRRVGYRDVYVIVEAELDAILIAQEAGDLCGVIALGSASTRPDRSAAEKLSKAAHIINALDADGAGAQETGKWWAEHYPDAVRWPVPEGKDPGDYYKAGGNIREWITEGLPEGLRGRA